MTHHAYGPLVVQISKRLWDGMTAAEQKLISESELEARGFQRALSRDVDKKALEELKSKGMTVTSLSAMERDRMRSAVKPAVDRLLNGYDQEFVKEFVAEVQRVSR